MNMHPLFLRHGHAFDLTTQARLMSTPERGVSEFAAFCILWPKASALLEAPARIDVYCPPRDVWYPVDMDPQISCGDAMVCAIQQLSKKKRALRVVLLDNTVIREWGAS